MDTTQGFFTYGRVFFMLAVGIAATSVPSTARAGWFSGRAKPTKAEKNKAKHIDRKKHNLGRAKVNNFGDRMAMTREITKKADKAVRAGKAKATGKGKFEVLIRTQDGTKVTVRGRSVRGRNKVATAFNAEKKKGWFW